MTKEERLERQREQRRLTNNAYTKKYEKTPKGYLMRSYRNMLSRVNGVQKLKYHLYCGKDILDRNEFYEWSIKNPEFNKLFNEYVKSGFTRALAPSPDRKDSSLGYSIENIEWVTMSENSRRGSLARHKKGD